MHIDEGVSSALVSTLHQFTQPHHDPESRHPTSASQLASQPQRHALIRSQRGQLNLLASLPRDQMTCNSVVHFPHSFCRSLMLPPVEYRRVCSGKSSAMLKGKTMYLRPIIMFHVVSDLNGKRETLATTCIKDTETLSSPFLHEVLRHFLQRFGQGSKKAEDS